MFERLRVQTLLLATYKSCILTVSTVMYTNPIVSTVNKPCFLAIADQIVKEDGTSTLAKRGSGKCLCTCGKNSCDAGIQEM